VTDNFSIYLDEITQNVVDAIPGAAFKGMEHLREVAVSKTPVETGNLRAEASTIPAGDGASVYYPGPYARLQEYGVSTSGKELRHEVGQSFFLVTSVLQETEAVLEIVANELRKAI